MGASYFGLIHFLGLLSLTASLTFPTTVPGTTWTVHPTTMKTRTQNILTLNAGGEEHWDVDENESLPERALNSVGSTTSAVVALTFYAVLVYKRDALMASFFIGAISNGILSKVAKKVLNQARPANLDTASLDLVPSDNGMPSSHAMSLGFIGVFTALHLPSAAIPLFFYAFVSLVYRVKTKLHSLDQVLVGASLGSFNGVVWKSLCHGANPWGLDVMAWVSSTFLNESGLLPWYSLAVPAVVGAAVVGSFERRLSRFLQSRSWDEKTE